MKIVMADPAETKEQGISNDQVGFFVQDSVFNVPCSLFHFMFSLEYRMLNTEHGMMK